MIHRFYCDIEIEVDQDGPLKWELDNRVAPNNEWMRNVFGFVPTKFVACTIQAAQGVVKTPTATESQADQAE